MTEWDLVVIGSGEAGKYLAWTMARHGWRTALVERSMVGGSCPNIACLPSKNVIHSAKVASLVSRANEFGLEQRTTAINMQQVFHRKQTMVENIRERNRENFLQSGTELIMGQARLAGQGRVEVELAGGGQRLLSAPRMVLSVGTRSEIPDIPGLRAAQPMTHIEALNLRQLPESVVVLGGGYIALEFAQALRRLGSRVTIVDRNPRLAHREDEEVSTALLDLLTDEGCDIRLNTTLHSVEGQSGDRVHLKLQSQGVESTLSATHLLAAVGRTPNTASLGLDLAGVQTNARGFIAVNQYLETSAPGIWAVGDCAGTPMFTHAAFDDFRVVRDAFLGHPRTTTGRLIPTCMFTDPQLVRIGLDEPAARRAGIAYRLFHLPAAAVLRTQTIAETRGFLQMLVAANSDDILGFTAFAPEASELLAAVQTAMLGKLPYTVLRDGIFAHPTIAEGLVFLLSGQPQSHMPAHA